MESASELRYFLFLWRTMDKLLEKNIASLKKRYPDLAKKIVKTELEKKYTLIKDKDGSYNLGIISSKKLYYNPVQKQKDLIAQFEKQGIRNAVIAVFLGFGLGYELITYYEEFSQRVGTKYMCIFERDLEIFKFSLCCHDFSNVIENKDIEFCVGETVEKLFPKFVKYFNEEQKFLYLNAIRPVYTQSSLELYGDYYLTCSKRFKEAARNKISDYGDSPMDSLIGTENMLSNLDEIIKNPGIKRLKNRFKNKPGIVIATGPSLDKNIDLLRDIGDKAVLVAAEASLRPLLNKGIKPHIITSLERTVPITELVKGFTEEEVKDVYLGACPVVDRTVYEVYKGPRVIVYRDFNHFKWLNIDKGILEIKISSGNMAFKVCEYLGCNPIILIGQDLAHNDDGKTHASGFVFPDKKGDKYKLIKVRGNVQKYVYTTNTWIQALNAYIRDVEAYKGQCINATEGGAFIQGTNVMDFKTALEKHVYLRKSYYPLEKIKKLLVENKFSVEQEKRDVIKLINDTKKDIENLLEGFEKGIEIIETNKSILINAKEDLQYFTDHKNEINEFSQKSGEIIKKTEQKNHYTLHYFLAHIIQSLTIHYSIKHFSIPNHYPSAHEAVPEQLLLKLDYYHNLIKTIKKAYSSLENAEELLKNGVWKRTENNILFHKQGMTPKKFKEFEKYFI